MEEAPDSHARSARRLLGWGLLSALLGTLLSGPVALLTVSLTRPQPPWRDAATFARHYHPIQLLPFAFGMGLVVGFALTVAGLHRLASPSQRVRTTAALIFTAAFVALIFLNYVLQVSFVPQLLSTVSAGGAPLIAAFSMTNPRSLAWGLEMWGYGLLGGATWLCAPVLWGAGWSARASAWAFALNGPVSIAGAVATVVGRDWLLQPAGLAAFAAWNALVVAMCALGLWSLRAPGPALLAGRAVS